MSYTCQCGHDSFVHIRSVSSGGFSPHACARCFCKEFTPVSKPGVFCEFCGVELGDDVFERYGHDYCCEKHSGKSDPDENADPFDEGHWR